MRTTVLNPEAAVFDCDGLLVDSSSAWARAFATAARAFEHDLTPADREALLGCSVESGARYLVGRLERPGEYAAVRELVGVELRAEVERDPPAAMPGASDLLLRLHGRLRLAVASNGPREVIVAMLTAVEMLPAFEVLRTAEDVRFPKPRPDVYLSACAGLSVAPGRTVALEDSAPGAVAALRAGMDLLLVGEDSSIVARRSRCLALSGGRVTVARRLDEADVIARLLPPSPVPNE